jgi:hypothetical protein
VLLPGYPSNHSQALAQVPPVPLPDSDPRDNDPVHIEQRERATWQRCEVPWNAPYYARCGFRVLDDSALSPGMQTVRDREIAHGPHRWPRVHMRRDLDIPPAKDAVSSRDAGRTSELSKCAIILVGKRMYTLLGSSSSDYAP